MSSEEEHHHDICEFEEVKKTENLIEFDPFTPLTEEVLMDFDIDEEKANTISFKDEKGMDQSYITVPLTYKGLPPYIVVSRESYGVQIAEFKKKDAPGKKDSDKVIANNAGMITLPQTLNQLSSTVPESSSASDEDGEKKPYIPKRKVQVALKLTQKPHPDDWTEEEAAVVDFLNNGVRKIWAHVLCRHLGLLSSAMPNLIPTVKESVNNDMADPEIAAKFGNDQNLMMQYTIDQIRKAVYNKLTKKVYRKKIKLAPGKKFDMNASPYDLTSCPGLYPLIKNYVNQKTGEEVVQSNIYAVVDGLDQGAWPSVSLDEALEYGRCNVDISILFDEPFLGSAVLSPKFTVGECYLKDKIQTTQGYTGRMIVKSRTPQDRSKIVKKTVNMNGLSSGSNSSPTPASNIIPSQPIPLNSTFQQQSAAPQSFNPAGFSMMTPAANNIQVMPVQQTE